MPDRTTTALALTALAFGFIAACTPPPAESDGDPARSSSTAPPAAALPEERLRGLLLTASDLGDDSTVRPSGAGTRTSSASVLDCEPLQRLGGGTGDPFADLPARAKAVIIGPTGRRTTEELYSAPPTELAQGIRQIMDAMAVCPSYQLASATAVVRIDTRTVPAPHLGQEQWAQVVTAHTAGRMSVSEQIVVRDGALLLVMSGPPSDVRAQAETAWAKATSR